MINDLVMAAEEAERIQAALANADAVMLDHVRQMRAGLAGALVGATVVSAAFVSIGEGLAAALAEPGQETTA